MVDVRVYLVRDFQRCADRAGEVEFGERFFERGALFVDDGGPVVAFANGDALRVRTFAVEVFGDHVCDTGDGVADAVGEVGVCDFDELGVRKVRVCTARGAVGDEEVFQRVERVGIGRMPAWWGSR